MSLGTWDPKAIQATNALSTWILVRETDDKQTGVINQEIRVCESHPCYKVRRRVGGCNFKQAVQGKLTGEVTFEASE